MSYLANPTFLLFLTLALYAVGVSLTEKKKWIIFNPIILSMTVLMVYLYFLEIPYENYEEAGKYIDFFLKPSIVGFKVMNLTRISNPMSQGIAMGTSSHAMGTMKAMEVSNKYGAFASVGMIFNGIFTAILAPIILGLLTPFI